MSRSVGLVVSREDRLTLVWSGSSIYLLGLCRRHDTVLSSHVVQITNVKDNKGKD